VSIYSFSTSESTENVEYDLESDDEDFLWAFNAHQSTSNDMPLTEDIFEHVIYLLEKECCAQSVRFAKYFTVLKFLPTLHFNACKIIY
jgi:hypothetical protein